MDYRDRLRNELRQFKDMEVVHDLPESFHYVSVKYLQPLVESYFGVSSFDQLVVKGIQQLARQKPETDIRVLSVGSGNCDYEINMAVSARLACHIVCMEINQAMLDRAAATARARGVGTRFTFLCRDANELHLGEQYDVVMANHSLHHLVELEHVFAEIDRALAPDSFLFVNDMIGRNGHMYWDETLEVLNRLWLCLPQHMKFHHQLNRFFMTREQWDCSSEGFEGIRAQDILRLLDQQFKFLEFLPFFSLMNGIIDRGCGHNFKVDRPMDRAFLDFAYLLDEYCLRERCLRPTQMIATLAKKSSQHPQRSGMFFDTPAQIYDLNRPPPSS